MDRLEPARGPRAPTKTSSHRCPRCSARHAERRTPRTLRERMAAGLLGRRPYRCLACGRRFQDRPARRVPSSAPSAPEPAAGARRSSLRQRRPRLVIDAGDLPLRPSQIYTLLAVGSVLLMLLLLVIRAMWPESTSAIRGAN